MDRDEQTRSAYEQIQEALKQALCWLQRPPADSPDEHDDQRSGLFSLGVAGGFAFAGLLPGIHSEALFDDISDAAEQRDLDQVGRIRRTVLSRLGADRLAAEQRMSSPMFFSHKGETQEQRQSREAAERAYHDREETSIQRAQNFGKRLAARDDESIRVPRSYSLNRGLVLGSHKKDHRRADDSET